VAVTANCKQTSIYFQSVQTDFKTTDVIVADNRVGICGTAKFIRDGKRVNPIWDCDVYSFSENGLMEKISSYCIPEKN
jgi:hypothetical protein